MLIFEVEGTSLCAFSLHPGSSDVSFLLKKKVLTWNIDLLDQARVCVLILFTSDLQSSFFSFLRECLDHEGLSLREEKFDLRDSLSLGSDSYSP